MRQGCLLSMLLYNIVTELLASFINADKRIKGIQIGDHEIEIVNLTDNTTIFLRDITCLNSVQVILRLYKNAKINYPKNIFFKKPSFYGAVHIKIELINQSAGTVIIYIKILEVNFGKSILDNSKQDKIVEGIAKNSYLEQSETLF